MTCFSTPQKKQDIGIQEISKTKKALKTQLQIRETKKLLQNIIFLSDFIYSKIYKLKLLPIICMRLKNVLLCPFY